MTQPADDHTSMIEQETNRRIGIYYDFKPGSEQCEVKPFTLKHACHSIYLSLAMVGLFAWAAISVFPAYFPPS